MSKPKHTPQRLADLKPEATIQCIRCEQPQPKAGALPFHSHWVCAGCSFKLQKGTPA